MPPFNYGADIGEGKALQAQPHIFENLIAREMTDRKAAAQKSKEDASYFKYYAHELEPNPNMVHRLDFDNIRQTTLNALQDLHKLKTQYPDTWENLAPDVVGKYKNDFAQYYQRKQELEKDETVLKKQAEQGIPEYQQALKAYQTGNQEDLLNIPDPYHLINARKGKDGIVETSVREIQPYDFQKNSEAWGNRNKIPIDLAHASGLQMNPDGSQKFPDVAAYYGTYGIPRTEADAEVLAKKTGLPAGLKIPSSEGFIKGEVSDDSKFPSLEQYARNFIEADPNKKKEYLDARAKAEQGDPDATKKIRQMVSDAVLEKSAPFLGVGIKEKEVKSFKPDLVKTKSNEGGAFNNQKWNATPRAILTSKGRPINAPNIGEYDINFVGSPSELGASSETWTAKQALNSNGTVDKSFKGDVSGIPKATRIKFNPETGKSEIYVAIVKPGATFLDKESISTGNTEGTSSYRETETKAQDRQIINPDVKWIPYNDIASSLEGRMRDSKGNGGFSLGQKDFDFLDRLNKKTATQTAAPAPKGTTSIMAKNDAGVMTEYHIPNEKVASFKKAKGLDNATTPQAPKQEIKTTAPLKVTPTPSVTASPKQEVKIIEPPKPQVIADTVKKVDKIPEPPTLSKQIDEAGASKKYRNQANDLTQLYADFEKNNDFSKSMPTLEDMYKTIIHVAQKQNPKIKTVSDLIDSWGDDYETHINSYRESFKDIFENDSPNMK